MILARIACMSAVALATGCFTADLDPAKEGAFACFEPDGSDCPEGRMCINGRCESEGPSVEITNPEDEQLFDIMDAPIDAPRMIGVRVSGNLELAPPSDEHVSGEGHVAILVDGVERTTIEMGGLSGGITVMIEVPNRAGPHRVAAVARRNDGVDYDNPEARFTRLFWIDDGTPQVALKSPWPNTVFGLDTQVMSYSVTSLRVQLVPPMPESPIDPDRGHVHIYYDESFPGCLMDPMCDPGHRRRARRGAHGDDPRERRDHRHAHRCAAQHRSLAVRVRSRRRRADDAQADPRSGHDHPRSAGLTAVLYMRATSQASHSPSCWRSSSVGVGFPAGGMSSFVAAGPAAAFQST